jgi:hypothetical protein
MKYRYAEMTWPEIRQAAPRPALNRAGFDPASMPEINCLLTERS